MYYGIIYFYLKNGDTRQNVPVETNMCIYVHISIKDNDYMIYLCVSMRTCRIPSLNINTAPRIIHMYHTSMCNFVAFNAWFYPYPQRCNHYVIISLLYLFEAVLTQSG